jgi:phospholipase C
MKHYYFVARLAVFLIFSLLLLSSYGGGTLVPVSSPQRPSPPSSYVLTVSNSGNGTVSSSPSGINCGSGCIANFPQGTAATLTAIPITNSKFVGWSGACSGTGPCVLNGDTNAAVTATFSATAYTLNVTLPGNGTGSVSSIPAGIACPPTCSASYSPGSQVSLTATPGANAYFAGWGGDCSGMGTCNVTLNANESVSSTINVWPFNHVIFMAQENRSLDHYFGAMRAYWAANGYPDQSFDGLPQFNPQQGIPPLYGPPPSNPTCDTNNPGGPPFPNCTIDANSPLITSFHLITQCIENPYPWWDPSHYNLDWANAYIDPVIAARPPMNGFVAEDAHFSLESVGEDNGHYFDTIGMRPMGYYDWTDLNYYYFMATNFATSDRWFSPTMTLTGPNRHYLIAGTSQGYVFPVGHSSLDPELTAQTIYQELQAAGISWKIYVNPQYTPCTPPYTTSCLVTYDDVYLKDFVWGYANLSYPQNLGTMGPAGTCGSSPCDFENDLANGTLPQVVQLEPASPASLDEHGSDKDQYPVDIQEGASYVSGVMNSVMQSSSWKDSVFIFTYDEMGGLYDHIPPQPAVSPDGIAPQDLSPGDICYNQPGPTCDFTWTGYRLPLIVVSPFAKKNYVSHTVMDTTAILKLIETRFNVPALTARDAAQPVMTEFFDFNNPPWITPPTPPVQSVSGPCYINQLP